MASKRRRSTSSNDHPETPAERRSRLAEMPDDILYHIASSLGTRESFKTLFSLSRRFRNLRTSILSLDFHCYCFSQFQLESFASSVNRTLALHEHTTTIKTLSFRTAKCDDVELFERIAKFVMSHGVRHLDFVKLPVRDRIGYYDMPILVSSFYFLTTLELVMHLSIKQPLFFPHMTTLQLSYVVFECATWFSSCRKLRELKLKYFSLSNEFENYYLTAPALAKLDIEMDKFFAGTLSISAPHLSWFCVKSSTHFPLVFNDRLRGLKTVRIEFEGSMEKCGDDKERQLLKKGVKKLLQNLGNAEDVFLSSGTVKLLCVALDKRSVETSEFCNVKSLVLHATPPKYTLERLLLPGNLMTYFLRSSPNAKVSIVPLVSLPLWKRYLMIKRSHGDGAAISEY